jgi:hypothetical protein
MLKRRDFSSICYLSCDVEFHFPCQYSRAGRHFLVSSFWSFNSDHAQNKRKTKRPSFHCFLRWLNSPGLSYLGEDTLPSEGSPRLALLQLWDFFLFSMWHLCTPKSSQSILYELKLVNLVAISTYNECDTR